MDSNSGIPLRSPEYDRLSSILLSLLHDNNPWRMNRDIFELERNEQRIAAAVCDATGMTPERWDTLDVFSREPWLEKTIAIVSKPVTCDDGVSSSESSEPIEAGNPLDALRDDTWMNHLDIAAALKVDAEPLRSRLDRWRKKNRGSDGWKEVAERKNREPRYLYRIGGIRGVLTKAMQAK